MGYGLFAAIGVFGEAGYLLDRRLNTSPWLRLADSPSDYGSASTGCAGLIQEMPLNRAARHDPTGAAQ
jgi:hypothetical protein